MELVKIIWLRADGLERVSYEMQASSLIEASRIFAEMVKRAKEEKGEICQSNIHK